MRWRRAASGGGLCGGTNQEDGDNGEDDDDNDDDDDDDDDDDNDDDDEENAHRLRSAPMQGGRASLWGLVPPTDMKAEEVDEATPKMLTRISKWQKDGAKYTLLVEWTNQQK